MRCPRLAAFLADIRVRHPTYWSRPVPAFGAPAPRILLVGLAPGLHGANRTGRPFTGDFAGILLYETLHELGLASHPQSLARNDGLALAHTRITNAVKCLPPANKPLPPEIRCCNSYLRNELEVVPSVRVIVALGHVAHDAVVLACGLPRSAFVFAHGREHALDRMRRLLDSYHCSRYNTQTRRLTATMFKAVIAQACALAELGQNGSHI
ncbi:MAG TPA: uracil-DNA glycosylase [Steroidobacteraceae bacterium]|nr:uracil-DNA glycosylase [Steroidobacteraceae bacterium]